ncbi:MAG TPA: DUF5134 domain-containing protein [Galbitalea sp.]|jgi:hypothetical protein
MIGPTWLAAILGIIMIAAAISAIARVIIAARTHTATDYEVDGHNVLMGIAMAGMLIPGLLIVTAGASTVAWIVVWVIVTVWFAISVIRDAVRHPGDRFTGHHLPHLVMSGAMVYMLAAPGMGDSSMSGSMPGMSAMGAGSSLPLPTLDYAFVIFMIGYAVLVIDRLPKIAIVGSGDVAVFGHLGSAAGTRILAPRGAALTNIVMAITMGYMLTMMFV